MSLAKRITRFLTPPPWRRPVHVEPVHWSDPQKEIADRLRPVLLRLLSSRPLDEQGLREQLSELKGVASRFGAYPTAAEIQNVLLGFPPTDDDGTPYKLKRGYELAGDLHAQHIHKEISAIEHKAQTLGPNVFEGYLNELLVCLFTGGLIGKSIESSIRMSEKLLVMSLGSYEYRTLYLTMAERAVRCVLDLLTERQEKAAEEQRAARLHRKGKTPAPKHRPPISPVDEELIAYLIKLQNAVRIIGKRFRDYPLRSLIRAVHELGELDQSKVEDHIEYLQGLLNIANNAGHLPFSGAIMAQIGMLRERLSFRHGREYFLEAARSFEAQGDTEGKLHLSSLSQERYKRAVELYLRAGDTDGTERSKSKMNE